MDIEQPSYNNNIADITNNSNVDSDELALSNLISDTDKKNYIASAINKNLSKLATSIRPTTLTHLVRVSQSPDMPLQVGQDYLALATKATECFIQSIAAHCRKECEACSSSIITPSLFDNATANNPLYHFINAVYHASSYNPPNETNASSAKNFSKERRKQPTDVIDFEDFEDSDVEQPKSKIQKVKQAGKISKKDNSSERKFWTEEETELLKKLVEETGEGDWHEKSVHFTGRKSTDVCNKWYKLKQKLKTEQNPDVELNDQEVQQLEESLKKTQKVNHGRDVWKNEEVELLLHLTSESPVGKISWTQIIPSFPGKTVKQVQTKYYSIHRDQTQKSSSERLVWTDNEIQHLRELVAQYGNNWVKIAQSFPRRNPKSISAKWYSIKTVKNGMTDNEINEETTAIDKVYQNDKHVKVLLPSQNPQSMHPIIDQDFIPIDQKPQIKGEPPLILKHNPIDNYPTLSFTKIQPATFSFSS